jgi:hypothetical protein
MSKDQQKSQEWTLDVSETELSNANPNNFGGEFRRVPFGDYDGEIADWQLEAKEGGKRPHTMSVVTFKITKAYEDKNADYVGDIIVARYAGSPQSPKMMQDSRARLFAAMKLGPGQHKRSAMIGKRISFSVIWNLAAPYMNQETGKTSRSVFANVTAERPVGHARPAQLDVDRLSAKAEKWIEENYGDDTDDAPTGERQAWEGGSSDAGAGADAGGEADAGTSDAPTFVPEAELAKHPDVASIMQYRAYIKLKTEHADAAREALVSLGVDPEGPINVDLIEDEPLKAALAPKPAVKAGGLPALGGGAKKGTRTKAA